MKKYIMIVVFHLFSAYSYGFDLDLGVPNMRGMKIDSNLRLNHQEFQEPKKRKEFKWRLNNYVRDNSRRNEGSCVAPEVLPSRRKCPFPPMDAPKGSEVFYGQRTRHVCGARHIYRLTKYNWKNGGGWRYCETDARLSK